MPILTGWHCDSSNPQDIQPGVGQSWQYEQYDCFSTSFSVPTTSPVAIPVYNVSTSSESLIVSVATSSETIFYSDWLFVNGVIIFCIVFLAFGVLFSILKR